MKTFLHRSLSCLLAVVLALSLAVPALAAGVPVTGLSLDQDKMTLTIGETAALKATVTPDNASNKKVTWKSNKETIASVSSTGVVTAKAEGTAAITATTSDGDYPAICHVTVEENYVTGVTITPAGPESLPVGKTRQLSAKVLYAHNTASGSQEVTWSSDAPAVATVSDKGLVTAQSEGTVSIIAMAKEKGKDSSLVYQMYKLTVTKAGTASDNDKLTLSDTAKTCFGGQLMESYLKAPAVTVNNGTADVTDAYTIAYAWTGEGSEALGTGQTQMVRPLTLTDAHASCTVTATSKTDSSKQLTGTCQYTIKVLPGTTVGAAVQANAGAVTLDQLMDLEGKQSILDQLVNGVEEDPLTPAIPGLTHVIFDLDGMTGGQAGALSAKNGVAYYLSPNADGEKLAQVAFTPAQTGTYEIPFLAYGDTTYYGQLEVVVTGGDPLPPTDADLTCDSAGIAFTGSDFFDPSDSDPVASMVFGKPSAGRLLRNFENGSGAQDEGNRYYTDSAANGEYHVSTLTYLPKADFSGQAVIPVTYTSKSGQVVARDLVIRVTKKTASAKFADVTEATVGAWAADSIDFAYACGLVSGVEETRFAPNSPMTRAMLVTVLYRAAGSPDVAVTTNFTDLNVGDYYYKAVVWANIMGVVNGTTDTTFSPNLPITREQIATILYRYADTMEENSSYEGDLNAFADKDKVSPYAVEPLTWAVSRGIISGTTSTTLSPLSATNRAQVAVMLHRYLAE